MKFFSFRDTQLLSISIMESQKQKYFVTKAKQNLNQKINKSNRNSSLKKMLEMNNSSIEKQFKEKTNTLKEKEKNE